MKHLVACLLIIGGFFSVAHAFDAAPSTGKNLPVGTATTTAPSPHAAETGTRVPEFSSRDEKLNLSFRPTVAAAPPMQAATPTQWSGSFFFDYEGGRAGFRANAVILSEIRPLTFDGHPTGWTLSGFAGTTVEQDGEAVAGLAAIRKWRWFDQVSFLGGIGITIPKLRPGVFVGAGVNF